MQFSAIFALSLAVMASASPIADLEKRTTGKDAETKCSAINNSSAVCCNSKTDLLGAVLSLIAIKSTCGGGKLKY